MARLSDRGAACSRLCNIGARANVSGRAARRDIVRTGPRQVGKEMCSARKKNVAGESSKRGE